MNKLISILGSTGSIGITTLNVIDKKKNFFKPYIFTANKNYKIICNQIIKYKPDFFIVRNKIVLNKLKKKLGIIKQKF